MVQQPLVGQGSLIIEASRSHSDTPHSVGLLATSDQPHEKTSVPGKTRHSQDPDINAVGGIRARNPSKQATAHPRLRQRGYWDRPLTDLVQVQHA